MTIFLVDENPPRSLAPELRRAGFDAEDVRDRGLAGHEDDEHLFNLLTKSYLNGRYSKDFFISEGELVRLMGRVDVLISAVNIA